MRDTIEFNSEKERITESLCNDLKMFKKKNNITFIWQFSENSSYVSNQFFKFQYTLKENINHIMSFCKGE